MLKTKKTTTTTNTSKTEDPLDVLIARLLEWCKAGCPKVDGEASATSLPQTARDEERPTKALKVRL